MASVADWVKSREAKWRRVLAGHAPSRMSIRAYCAKHGVKEQAFYWWRAKLARHDATKPAAFVPIVVEPVASVAACDIVMLLRGGRELHLPASLSMEKIGVLVRAIEGAA